jgi:hypothetical protein
MRVHLERHLMVECWLLAGCCAFDERQVTFAGLGQRGARHRAMKIACGREAAPSRSPRRLPRPDWRCRWRISPHRAVAKLAPGRGPRPSKLTVLPVKARPSALRVRRRYRW